MQIRNRSYTATKPARFASRLSPLSSGNEPAGATQSAGGGDLLNHYFVEALLRRLEELEEREHERAKEMRKEHSEDFQSWLRVPANEQDSGIPVNRYTREKAINAYRKIAAAE